MWDGNPRTFTQGLRMFVEREPMWDGNVRSRIRVSIRSRLSENQCGMETCTSLRTRSLQQVEREPMWDGNISTLSRFKAKALLSENQCGMETFLEKKRDSRTGLSENQCGMETWGLLLLVGFEDMLSENQCGMETLPLWCLFL